LIWRSCRNRSNGLVEGMCASYGDEDCSFVD